MLGSLFARIRPFKFTRFEFPGNTPRCNRGFFIVTAVIVVVVVVVILICFLVFIFFMFFMERCQRVGRKIR